MAKFDVLKQEFDACLQEFHSLPKCDIFSQTLEDFV
jgi:hypothetical protein